MFAWPCFWQRWTTLAKVALSPFSFWSAIQHPVSKWWHFALRYSMSICCYAKIRYVVLQCRLQLLFIATQIQDSLGIKQWPSLACRSQNSLGRCGQSSGYDGGLRSVLTFQQHVFSNTERHWPYPGELASPDFNSVIQRFMPACLTTALPPLKNSYWQLYWQCCRAVV